MIDHTTCAGCGRAIAGGEEGCRAEFDRLCASDYSGAVPYALHRLAVDAYSLQHPAEFCASGKSYAAHLCGLLVAQDHAGSAAAQQALRGWLDGARKIARPEPPDARGTLTLAHVLAADGGDARERALLVWANAVWAAYAAQHALAARWLAEAFEWYSRH